MTNLGAVIAMKFEKATIVSPFNKFRLTKPVVRLCYE